MFEWLKRRFGGRSAYRRLARLVMNDAGTAERLIAYELKREPRLSREQAIERAIGRLEHERTR
jgi:hypothetical protein